MTAARDRLEELAVRYGLPPGAATGLDAVLDALRTEPVSLTTVRDPVAGADVHVADSLSALTLPEVRHARRIADVGSGAGFPGLVLAAALPEARVALVESVGRKCAWLERARDLAGVPAVEVVCARAEDWPNGLGAHDLVTARAVAPLAVLVEYAAPLLAAAGSFVAYKGRRDDAEERAGRAAGEALGIELRRVVPVSPWPGAGDRHLYLWSKVRDTPAGYPRRPGMARKRPVGASGRG